MKRKIFLILLTAVFAFSGLTSLPVFAHQASDLETGNAAAAIFQVSDEIFQTFNPEAIYEGIKKILDLPQALNFWNTDSFSNFKGNIVEGLRKGLKAFEKPDFLELAIGEAYKAQNDPVNSLNKNLGPNQVRFTSPTEFEVPSVYQGSVSGNTLYIKASDGSFDGEIDLKIDPAIPETLTITVTDQTKHEQKIINLNVIDDGMTMTDDEKLLLTMTIGDDNTILFSNPEDESAITIAFDQAAYTIHFTNVSPEKSNAASIVLDPQKNLLSLTIDGNEIFSAIFDKANAELNVNIMESSNVLQFVDAEKAITGSLEMLQSTVKLSFENAENKIAVSIGSSLDDLMEMFALSVDKEAKSFNIIAFGSPIFQAAVDSVNRTVTIIDEKGQESVLTEDDLNQMIEEMSKSAVPGSDSKPGTVKFQ